jgi:hypothetical protein
MFQALLRAPERPLWAMVSAVLTLLSTTRGRALDVARSRRYRLLDQAAGAVQSSGQWIFARNFVAVLAVIASAGCNQPVDALRKDDENSRLMTREDVYRRQLDLDVAAIIRGMASAHRAQAAALTPEPESQTEPRDAGDAGCGCATSDVIP